MKDCHIQFLYIESFSTSIRRTMNLLDITLLSKKQKLLTCNMLLAEGSENWVAS